MIRNRHSRIYSLPAEAVGRFLDTLSSAEDCLWPRHSWPAMRLDGPLAVGARGGHGPIRYRVEDYLPGKEIVFRFTMSQLQGIHRLQVVELEDGRSRLEHTLEAEARGPMRVLWPLYFRPLHDALLEDALDMVWPPPGRRLYSPWVRLLRWVSRLLLRRLR